MSRTVRTLEALQDAISRVPKIGSAGVAFDDLAGMLRDVVALRINEGRPRLSGPTVHVGLAEAVRCIRSVTK